MKLIEKLKNNRLIFFILIIGIALMLFPSQGGDGEKKITESGLDYEKQLTEKTEEVLSLIEGAGKVKIVLTLEDKGTTYPVTEKSSGGERTVSSSGKLAVSKENYPTVRGVVAVASGADNERVREDIINAIRAVTGAELHNIKVFKMKG